jgi:hypothetical protein
MSNNVVCLTTTRREVKKQVEVDEAHEFISIFYDWARERGIDTTTTEFKFDAAVILTTIQSLLHERD